MKRKFSYKAVLLSLLALLICLSAVVLSVAYLKQQTGAVTNTFVRGEDPTLTYRLAYDLNGGTSDPIPTEVYEAEAAEEQHDFQITSEIPVRGGYRFIGWADSAEALGPDYSDGGTITVTKDEPTKTLYAVWEKVDDFVLDFKYTLPDGVKGANIQNMPARMTAQYEGSSRHTFTVTSVPYDANTDETGLTFLGWTTVEGGSVVYPAADEIDVTVSQQYTVLYAVWGYEYFVKFDRNPGDEGTVGKHNRADGALVNEDPADQILLSSDSKTVSPYLLYESGAYSYVRENYLLVGFSSKADGTTPEEYVTVGKPGRNNAKTVYAIWVQGNYALIYDANGGSNAPATQPATAGALSYTFTISTQLPTKMEGSNGVFKGWAIRADAEAPDFVWDEGSKTFNPATVELDINDPVRVLYAVWEYTYTLTYQRGLADADSSMPENQTVKSSKPTYTFTIPKEPMPTRGTEYLFHYWAEQEERTEGEFRYCDVANYFDKLTLTAINPSAELYPRFRPADGYTLIFVNTELPTMKMTTTESFGSFTIPAQTPSYSSKHFLGWADKAHYDKREVQYQPGDVVRLNPDVEGHTLRLYAVTRSWDTLKIHVDYNGGSYGEKKWNLWPPGWVWKYTYSYDTSAVYFSGTTYTATAGPFYTPTRSNYTLIGFNYRNNGTEAVFNQKNGDSGVCDGKKSQITLNNVQFDASKYNTGEQDITRTENTDGSYAYVLNIYAVWGKNDVYDKYEVYFDKNHSESGSSRWLTKTIKQADGDYEVTFSTTKENVNMTRTGYKLVGYAYDAAGTQVYARMNGNYLDRDVTVSQSDTEHITVGSYGTEGKSYTLKLYAIWEEQQVFNLTLDYNGGSYWDSSSSKYLDSETKTETRPPEETAYTWGASTTYNTPTRYGYILKGFAYTEDATESDFIMSGSKFPEGMTVDKDDPHTVSGTVNGVPSTTLTLYAVWEKQQIFRLVQDFNGGTYTYSGGSTVKTETKNAIVERGPDSYTFSTTTPTVPTRSGYRLLGYAYTKDATDPDFVRSGTSFTPGITISKLDTEHEIKTYQRDGVDVTELTVYAVWEKEKQFTLRLDPNGGTPAATESQTFGQSVTQATWEAGTKVTVPTRSGFTFLGYATSRDATVPLYTLTDGKLDQPITFTDEQEGVIHNKDSAPETHTLTLYAVWKPMRRFAVTINQNVGTSPSDYTTYSSIYYDKSVTSATIALDSDKNSALGYYSGYNLKGAAYTSDAKAVNFVGNSFNVVVDTADTEHVTVTTDSNGVETVTLKLYAIWSVKLNYTGKGTGLPSTVEVINPTAEERVISIAKVLPKYNEFLFAGWATLGDRLTPAYAATGYYTPQGNGSVLQTTITLEGNTTLYAVWMQKYVLGYNANGGDENTTPPYENAFETLNGTTTNHTFAVGAAIPTHPDGLTFLGWSTKPNATAATYQPGGTILVAGNEGGSETVTTLYAVWQEDTGETTADETTETDGPLLAPSAPETADGGTEGLRLDTEALVGLRVAEAEHRSVWQRGEDMELTLVAKEGYALPQSMLVTVQEEQYVLPQREGEKLPDKLTYDAASGKLTVPAELLQETDTVILAAHAGAAVPAVQNSLLRTEQTVNGKNPSAPTDGASEVAPAEALPEVAPTEEAPEAAPTENLSEVAPVEAPPEVTLPEASPEEPPQPSETVEAAAAEPAPPLENCGSPAPPGEAETLE